MAEVTTNKETTGLDPFPKGEFYTKDTGNFWVRFPWIFAGFIAFVVGILWYKGWAIWGIVTLLLFLQFRFVDVLSTAPPQFALLKIWEKVCEGTRRPGRYLMLPYFPFFMSFQNIPKLYQELTFHFKKIPCRLTRSQERGGEDVDSDIPSSDIPSAGGTIDLEIGLAIEPDQAEDFPLRYILSGGEDPSHTTNHETTTKLHDLVWNNLVQSVQEYALQNAWEDMVFVNRELIGAFLLRNLMGEPLEGIGKDIDLTNVNPGRNMLRRVRTAYRKCLGTGLDGVGEPNATVKRWGFKLRQFKVGPIVGPEELQIRARAIAEEQKKQEEEMVEAETMDKLIKKFMEDSRPIDDDGNPTGPPTLSYFDARKEARVQKHITVETIDRKIFEIPGMLEVGGQIADAIIGKRGNSNGNH